jgi:hypothetical protein
MKSKKLSPHLVQGETSIKIRQPSMKLKKPPKNVSKTASNWKKSKNVSLL